MKEETTSRRSAITLSSVMENGVFCPDPWTELSAKVSGYWALCCVSGRLPYKFSARSPLCHYRSRAMQEVRRAMLEGDKRPLANLCNKCWLREKASGQSRRLHRLRQLEKDSRLKSVMEKHISDHLEGREPAEPRYVDRMDLEIFSNICNLRCVMCNERSSSSIGVEKKVHNLLPRDHCIRHSAWEELDESQKERFWSDIRRLISVTRAIKFIGGEPLLDRTHYELLDVIVSEQLNPLITLEYTSNITLFPTWKGRSVLDRFADFQAVKMRVSVDGLGKVNDYIRHGSSFERVVSNIQTLRRYANVQVVVTVAVSSLNIALIPDLVDYFKPRVDAVYFDNIVVSPAFFAPWHLPDSIKAEVVKKLDDRCEQEAYRHLIECLQWPREESRFRELLRHLDSLDRMRGTSMVSAFPWLAPYLSGVRDVAG